MLAFSQEAKIPIIHGNDSHYIHPSDSKYRTIYQRGKDVYFDDDNENTMILDYPTYEEIERRYAQQGILTVEQVHTALENTLVFDTCEPITIINDEIKLPPFSKTPNEDLKKLINQGWKKAREKIPIERHQEYIKAIREEVDIVEKTNMANYFLIDNAVVDRAEKVYGGKLTNTGRGSSPSFYINKLLELTDIDRLDAPVTLFPSRFMSVERILQTRSLPDLWIIM
jgi:DNA polymerase III alpha subunit